MEVVRKIKNKEIDPRNEALGVKIGVGGADGAVGNGNRVGRKSCCYWNENKCDQKRKGIKGKEMKMNLLKDSLFK